MYTPEVKLIWATPEADSLIAYLARVSNPANQTNEDTAPRLIEYLIRNKHWSPFEMVSACLSIRTTRDIGRQILRHRSFSFQEFSQRYATTAQSLPTLRECREQDNKNRQNSIKTEDSDKAGLWSHMQQFVWSTAIQAYNTALKEGIAKEQARALLPEGMTETHMYMAGTLRSWLHYCALRQGNETQREHQYVANLCWHTLRTTAPVTCEAFAAHNGPAPALPTAFG